jgi:hypothetical protein
VICIKTENINIVVFIFFGGRGDTCNWSLYKDLIIETYHVC